ncbi:2-polyprenyl-6-methoxyphenol hydroxylase-like FAD-dependent oxidoreductase [Murinocardiopsis flavida]|uniref:2-polyprenyl-6-methoxyphenol hydroxylase-like FAD-dependent oxidoreductase n=1 Tax=Murinocardiopsis flavida TaxID=645275 RepID=A0A2P8DUN7_9ACTN|nr:FAD-dependent monooxygenase [Murinocardiopsis flavida]PSL00933.1 2-polyprenyl-6-methoxyphenol hydroxylase-like FAD-dependent oxidoreductase [Murinocardiopsis flavida]
MKALIIGSGVGGPVAAAAFKRVGIDSVVYEAHQSTAAALGSFLSLAPNGLAVLRALDLLDPIRAQAELPTTAIQFQNGSGRSLGVIPDNSEQLGADLSTITIMRGALQDSLAEAATAQGARIEFGKRMVGYTETENGVTVEFDDGTTDHGDVLIGADGIHSRTRSILDPAAPKPEYTGLLNCGGVAPPVDAPGTPESTMRMIFGSRAFFGYQVAPDGSVYWFVNFPYREPGRAELAAQDPAEWRRHIIDLFSDDSAFITRILEASPVENFQTFGVYDIASLPHWSRGRVGLLGDAAHAVSSSSGQGASLAMEDAVTLAKHLRDIDDPVKALHAYQEARRPRVESIVAEGRRRGNNKLTTGTVQVFLRDLTLPVVFAMISWRKKHSWIFDHRIDMAAPANGAR